MLKIICLVKQVPDTTEITIDKETNTLIRTGVPNIINPDDLAGVEEALRLKEKHGGTVTTVTMGPPQAENMIRELYSRGVDDAYLLTDRKFGGSDTWATSTIISTFLKTLEFDLLIAGYQAIDGDTAQVGPQVAAFLDIPQVTHISEIKKISKNLIVVEKEYETERLELEVELPALITTITKMNEPRYMNAFDIYKAFDKEVHFVSFNDLKVDESKIGLQGSPTRVKRTYTKEVLKKSDKEILEPEAAAKRIVKLLYPYIEVSKK